jgi:hypothetical protein
MSHPDPSSPDALSSRLLNNNQLAPPLSEADLQLHAAELEAQSLRARVKHLEDALRVVGNMAAPYVGGNGR